jgi:hypothetical protein
MGAVVSARALRSAVVLSVLASTSVSTAGGSDGRQPSHLILFPPIANATEREARRRQLPHEALYAHGHDVRQIVRKVSALAQFIY